jgi:ABC-type Fe2+-enterobactin transport system substrate-binding protein
MEKQVTYKGKSYTVKIDAGTQAMFLTVLPFGVAQIPDDADLSTIKKMIIEMIEVPANHLEAQFNRWDGNLDAPEN